VTEFRVQLVEVNVVCNSERIIKIGTVLICQSYAQMKNGPVFFDYNKRGRHRQSGSDRPSGVVVNDNRYCIDQLQLVKCASITGEGMAPRAISHDA